MSHSRFDSRVNEGVVYFVNYLEASNYRDNTPGTVMKIAPEMWHRRGYPYMVKPADMGRVRTEPEYTVEAGRGILRYGVPFISIQRRDDAQPVEADDVTKFIAQQLNEHGWGGYKK